MKRIIAFFVAAMMGLTFLAACSPKETPAADSSWDEIKEKGYFIVGLDDAFPPMGYTDESGNIVGFDIDLAKAVAAEMGVEVRFQPVIWENISMEINNKNVDVIWNGCTITDERKEVFNFSKPYMLNSQVLVVQKDSPYQTQADLADKVLGLQDGSSANEALEKNADFKATLKSVNGYQSNDQALMDLASGRLDAVLVDVCVYGYYADQQPDTYRTLEGDLGSEEFGIAFHQEANTFREALQVALDKVIESGAATEISNKVFGRDVIAR